MLLPRGAVAVPGGVAPQRGVATITDVIAATVGTATSTRENATTTLSAAQDTASRAAAVAARVMLAAPPSRYVLSEEMTMSSSKTMSSPARFGIAVLDDALANDVLCRGAIVELAGPSGVGKTALAASIVAATASLAVDDDRNDDVNNVNDDDDDVNSSAPTAVLVVDAGGGAGGAALNAALTRKGGRQAAARVVVANCSGIADVVDVLSATAAAASAVSAKQPLRLVVVDDVALLLAPLGAAGAVARAAQTRFLRTCSIIASTGTIVLLVAAASATLRSATSLLPSASNRRSQLHSELPTASIPSGCCARDVARLVAASSAFGVLLRNTASNTDDEHKEDNTDNKDDNDNVAGDYVVRTIVGVPLTHRVVTHTLFLVPANDDEENDIDDDNSTNDDDDTSSPPLPRAVAAVLRSAARPWGCALPGARLVQAIDRRRAVGTQRSIPPCRVVLRRNGLFAS